MWECGGRGWEKYPTAWEGGGVLLPTASTISIPTRNPILIGGAGALLKGGSLGRGLRSGKQGFVLVGNSNRFGRGRGE